jgi:hypothetical protein
MKKLFYRLIKVEGTRSPFTSSTPTPEKRDVQPVQDEKNRVFQHGKYWTVKEDVQIEGGGTANIVFEVDNVHTTGQHIKLSTADRSQIMDRGLKVDKYREIKAYILQGKSITDIVNLKADVKGYKRSTVEKYSSAINKALDNESKPGDQGLPATAT